MSDPAGFKYLILPGLSLFGALSTLLCCALPALLVTLGMGAVVAGLISAAPWLIWLSAHKLWLFAVSGALLLLSAGLFWRGRYAPCPADPAQARACRLLRRFTGATLIAAALIYILGFFFAFLAARVFYG